MRQLPYLQDVSSDLQINNPQVNIEINRNKASVLGVSAQQIEDALSTAYAGRQISTILTPNNEYQVLMELEPQYQMDASALSLLHIRSSQGKLVPLNTLVSLSHGAGPLSVNHLGQIPSVTISFNLKPDVSLGEAMAGVEKLARSILPASIATSFQGTAQAFQSSQQGLLLLLIMTIVIIYIMLGILYESFIHPLTILSGLPSAGFGALLTLMIFHKDLSLYAFVGLIMLIGIVKKNAIMMIDFALDAQRKDGKSPSEAIYQGCLGPLPPHHDDDHGGPHGHSPDRPRFRSRSGITPSSGPCRRGGSAFFTVDHPLHHAGCLRLPGQIPGKGEYGDRVGSRKEAK